MPTFEVRVRFECDASDLRRLVERIEDNLPLLAESARLVDAAPTVLGVSA